MLLLAGGWLGVWLSRIQEKDRDEIPLHVSDDKGTIIERHASNAVTPAKGDKLEGVPEPPPVTLHSDELSKRVHERLGRSSPLRVSGRQVLPAESGPVSMNSVPGIENSGSSVENARSTPLVVAPAEITGVTRWTIETSQHRGSISALAYHPERLWLASTSAADGTLRLWKSDLSALQKILFLPEATSSPMACSPDGTLIALGGPTGVVAVLDWRSGQVLDRTTPHTGRVNDFCWKQDATVLASAGQDGLVRFWSRRSRRTIKQVSQERPVLRFARDNEQDVLVSLDDRGRLCRWDFSTGEPRAPETPAKPLHGARGLADYAKHLATLDALDNPWLIWDDLPIAWSPDGARMAASVGNEVMVKFEEDAARKLTWGFSSTCRPAWSSNGTQI